MHKAARPVNPQRRHLIKLGAAGLLLVPVSPILASDEQISALNVVAIGDDVAAPLFKEGDYLLADCSITGFSGEGLYLFPAWGQPRVYLVTLTPGVSKQEPAALEFRNPASGDLQWTQTLAGESLFAGKICGRVSEASELAGFKLAALSVPQFPRYS